MAPTTTTTQQLALSEPASTNATAVASEGPTRASPPTSCSRRSIPTPRVTSESRHAPPRLDDPALERAAPPEHPDARRHWLTYRQAAAYCGWSVNYVRNLVSAGQIPVYGKPRVRRFRRDMLDLFLTNPDAAMRKFRAERNSHAS